VGGPALVVVGVVVGVLVVLDGGGAGVGSPPQAAVSNTSDNTAAARIMSGCYGAGFGTGPGAGW
jgi:hypothetical protein